MVKCELFLCHFTLGCTQTFIYLLGKVRLKKNFKIISPYFLNNSTILTVAWTLISWVTMVVVVCVTAFTVVTCYTLCGAVTLASIWMALGTLIIAFTCWRENSLFTCSTSTYYWSYHQLQNMSKHDMHL
jgi:hypothetical protein